MSSRYRYMPMCHQTNYIRESQGEHQSIFAKSDVIPEHLAVGRKPSLPELLEILVHAGLGRLEEPLDDIDVRSLYCGNE